MFEDITVSPEQEALLRKAGDKDYNTAVAAQHEIAMALTLPLRKGVMAGDPIGWVFQEENLAPDASPEYPLDPIAPGTEKDFAAYVVPNAGLIPQRHAEGDYVMVPTYRVSNSIDCLVRYVRSARWQVVTRYMEVLRAGFAKKIGDDRGHTLLSAGVDRNIVVYDSDATAGLFTKRLITLMQVIMKRNAGGNSASLNRGTLTDLFLSPESNGDIRNWGVDQIDEVTRREIFQAGDVIPRIFGVNLHEITELGENQEYQTYFSSTLAGSLAASDVELLVGLDLRNQDSFVAPVKQQIEVHEDPFLHRQGRVGWWADAEMGVGVLDNRRVILGSC